MADIFQAAYLNVFFMDIIWVAIEIAQNMILRIQLTTLHVLAYGRIGDMPLPEPNMALVIDA